MYNVKRFCRITAGCALAMMINFFAYAQDSVLAEELSFDDWHQIIEPIPGGDPGQNPEKSSALHGTVWQYGGIYDCIGFYNHEIYILIDPEVAAPDPPYWNDYGMDLFYEYGDETYFVNRGLLAGYSGHASKATGRGYLYIGFFIVVFPPKPAMMRMLRADWTPHDPIEVEELYEKVDAPTIAEWISE